MYVSKLHLSYPKVYGHLSMEVVSSGQYWSGLSY